MRIGTILRPTSIRARLIIWSVGLMALVLVLLGVVLRWSVQFHLMDLVDRDLQKHGRSMAGGFSRFFGPHWHGHMAMPDNGRKPWRKPPTDPDRPVSPDRSLDLQAKPLFPFSNDRPWDLEGLASAARGSEEWTTILEKGERFRVFSIPLRAHGQIVGITQTAKSLTDTERDLDGVSRTMLMLIPVALLIVAISAALLTHRLLRPVRQVASAAERINASDLSERLPVMGGDEFAGLARTLNAMLARLEQSFEQQRRFVADASHELKTPLTAIRAHTSMALHGEKTPVEYRQTLKRLDRSAALMGHVVQDLLLLARADAGQFTMELRSVSLLEVLEMAIESVQAPDRALIRVEGADVRVLGEGVHLIRLFTNLLDNAARHTPSDGLITAEVSDEGWAARAIVRDTGCGIAPEHLPHVCERFYRVDESRTRKQGGTGLGLALCQSIVVAHNGEMHIESEPGLGTTVTITLPLALNS